MRISDSSSDVCSSDLMRLGSGEVVDLTKLGQDRMKDVRGVDISVVFQDPMASLNPVFTIGFQICEAIVRHQGKTMREARAIALNALKLVRVPEAEKRMKQHPHPLPGGMRQREFRRASCRERVLQEVESWVVAGT